MRKKALCFLFAFMLILTAFPVTALADDNYGIMVGGTLIDSTNAADVFGDGTVSFDPETETLTLNGASIGDTLIDGDYIGIYIERANPVTIKVTAESTVLSSEREGAAVAGVYSEGDMIITGETLNVVLRKSKLAFGFYSSEGSIDFVQSKAYIDATNATDEGCAIRAKVRVSIDDSSIRAYALTRIISAEEEIAYISGTFISGHNDEGGYEYLVTYPKKPDVTPDPDKPPVPPEDELPPVEEEEEEIINTDTDIKDVKGSRFRPLMLKATAKGRTITLTWKKVSGADGYIIYGARCGQPLKRLKTLKNGSTVKRKYKNLKKGKYYRYIVVAYKNTEKGRAVITKSKSVHCKTKGGKKGNPTGIRLKTKVLTLKRGKTKTLKPVLLCNKPVATHIAKFRYESSDTDIVTVSKSGKIKAKNVGVAYVYVVAQNGLYKKVKVIVK